MQGKCRPNGIDVLDLQVLWRQRIYQQKLNQSDNNYLNVFKLYLHHPPKVPERLWSYDLTALYKSIIIIIIIPSVLNSRG